MTDKPSQSAELPPGFELLRTLSGHADRVMSVCFSPDGKCIASGGLDTSIRLWDAVVGHQIGVFEGETDYVRSVAFSPDGKMLASSGGDGSILLWDVASGKFLGSLTGHTHRVLSVAFSPDGRRIVSSSYDKSVRLWDIDTHQQLSVGIGHTTSVESVAFSPDGTKIASGSDGGTVRQWDAVLEHTLPQLEGHYGAVSSLVYSPDGRILASGRYDKSMRLWDVASGKQLVELTGHTSAVMSVAFSPDGTKLVSASSDDSVRLWDVASGKQLAKLLGHTDSVYCVAFSPDGKQIVSGGEDSSIRLWRLPTDWSSFTGDDQVRYTTAKIVLVGDSGVGKTGLGYRLAHGDFKEHPSTHGQQFWVIDELGTTRKDGTQCEAVLWDLAGQPDYRLVHVLSLDDIDVALLLFDPTKREDTLVGVEYWLEQLCREGKRCRTVLVAARADRGEPTLTESELIEFCQRRAITGGYYRSSALANEGIDELFAEVKKQIPWDEKSATISPDTFHRTKDYVLSLKEMSSTSVELLVSPASLRSRLQAIDEAWRFTDDEMMTAVGHLQNHGYVTILRSSDGKQSILLTPDVLVNLASSFVLEARRNPKGLGVLEEDRLLQRAYRFPELANLVEDDQELLLDAATALFLEHNLCFRQSYDDQTLLVYPSLINQKRPIDDTTPTVEDLTYRVRGAVEHLYPALVVLMGYSNQFVRTNQWQNQAEYADDLGNTCGFTLVERDRGPIELVLYYSEDADDHARLLFRGLFEGFLARRSNIEVARYPRVVCSEPECGQPLNRDVMMARLDQQKPTFCNDCGSKLTLPSAESLTRLSPQQQQLISAEEGVADRRTKYETALARVKGVLRDEGKSDHRPTCFICYAWDVGNRRWVAQLGRDLHNASIDVCLDRWEGRPGRNLDELTQRIHDSEFVLVVGTPLLLDKYYDESRDAVVRAELEQVHYRLRQPNRFGKNTVIPLLREGSTETSLSPILQPLIQCDFREEKYYFRTLFDLVLTLHRLPTQHSLLDDLRDEMDPDS